MLVIIESKSMKIAEKYAMLIIHFSFQSINLLDEIRNTAIGPERDELISKLEALKECMSDEIAKLQKEIAKEFRQNKAVQLVLELG